MCFSKRTFIQKFEILTLILVDFIQFFFLFFININYIFKKLYVKFLVFLLVTFV